MLSFSRFRLVCCTLVCLAATLPVLGHTRHEKWGEGFTVDLDKPYQQVLNVVQALTEDGIVRGTHDYRGETELDGATPAKDSDAFPKWAGQGTVLYKVRPKALAPEHFHEANDEGTITVRYVVQSLGPNSTRLRIDAVFKESTHHHTAASDGAVEDGEFEAISLRLKDIEDAEERRRLETERSQLESKLQVLQDELEKENSQLATLTATEQQLQQQIETLQAKHAASVKTESADLKAQPYNQAKTVQSLAQGEKVTVLQSTKNWFHVLAANGKDGWIYRPMLQAGAEAAQ
jgi:Bacterial SH3 domain